MLYTKTYSSIKAIQIPAFLSILFSSFPFLLLYLEIKLEQEFQFLYSINCSCMPVCGGIMAFLVMPFGKASTDAAVFRRAQEQAILSMILFFVSFFLFLFKTGFEFFTQIMACFAATFSLRCMVKGFLDLSTHLNDEKVDAWGHWLSLLLSCMLGLSGGSVCYVFLGVIKNTASDQTLSAIPLLIALALLFPCAFAAQALLFPFLRESKKMLLYAFAPEDSGQFSGASVLPPSAGYSKENWQIGKGLDLEFLQPKQENQK